MKNSTRDHGLTVNFASHIPSAVRDYITSQFGTSTDKDYGSLAHRHNELKTLISKYRSDLRAQKSRHQSEHIITTTEDLRTALQYQEHLNRQIRAYQLLASSDQMREAYAILLQVFTTDSEWCRYIYEAVSANLDYKIERERQQRLVSLQERIGDASKELLAMLVEYDRLARYDVYGPVEFWHIPNLFWRRSHEFEEVWHDQAEAARFWRFDSNPEEQPTFTHADTKDIICKLIDASQCSEPRNAQSRIVAAISKQKRNPKTEYIRAFWHGVSQAFGPLGHDTKVFIRPVAITATVILDQPELVVSYDDVRKAIKRGDADRVAEHSKALRTRKSSTRNAK